MEVTRLATLEIIFTTLALIFFLKNVWIVLNWAWFKPKKLEKLLRAQGLKGTPYRLILGDSTTMMKMWAQSRRKNIDWSDDIVPRVLPFQHYLRNKHGKNSFAWVGSNPMVLVSDPNLIKEIFDKNMVFTKPVISPLLSFLLNGLAFYNGDKWSEHRKIMNPAFHMERLKNILPAMHFCCTEMMNEWESIVGENKSCEFDVLNPLKIMTGDVIARSAFGSNYEEGKKIFQLQKELNDFTATLLFAAYIPGWRFIPTKKNKRMTELNKELQALVNVIVSKRRESLIKGEIAEDDLLGMLLKSNQEQVKRENKSKKGEGLISIEDVVQECRLFYFAGQDAAAYLITWTMILLSKHQDWQMKAREEVMQVFGKNTPDYVGLGRLRVVTMILNEVLRLYPSGVLIPRIIEKDTRIGGMDLPAGTSFLLPVLQIHRDLEHWGEDASEFKPERFSEGIVNATQKKFTYFPFGWGSRVCIGSNYGTMEVKLAISMILQRFSFELSPSYVHAPYLMVTLQAQYGAPLILHKLYNFENNHREKWLQ